MSDGPVMLWFYDADADDRRGVTRDVGVYRSRAKAEAYAVARNREILASARSRENADHQDRMRAWKEHQALVAAGLRVERPGYAEPTAWHCAEDRLDHYGVSEIEYEDD